MFGFESWAPKGLNIANFVNRFSNSQKLLTMIRQKSLKLILFEFQVAQDSIIYRKIASSNTFRL